MLKLRLHIHGLYPFLLVSGNRLQNLISLVSGFIVDQMDNGLGSVEEILANWVNTKSFESTELSMLATI